VLHEAIFGPGFGEFETGGSVECAEIG